MPPRIQNRAITRYRSCLLPSVLTSLAVTTGPGRANTWRRRAEPSAGKTSSTAHRPQRKLQAQASPRANMILACGGYPRTLFIFVHRTSRYLSSFPTKAQNIYLSVSTCYVEAAHLMAIVPPLDHTTTQAMPPGKQVLLNPPCADCRHSVLVVYRSPTFW